MGAAYNYSIRFVQENNADALSRLPRPVAGCTDVDLVHLVNHLSETPAVSADKIKQWTQKDPLLAKVHRWVGHHKSVDQINFIHIGVGKRS